MSLGGSFAARREEDRFIVGPASRPDEKASPCFEISLAVPGTTVLPEGGNISCRLDTFDPAAFAEHLRASRRNSRGEPATENFDRYVEWLDADQVHGPLLLRPRRDGDAFEPLGGPGGKSVGDFLTDLKLPRPLRRKVLCLCDELGIVCLWPLRIDQRVRVTERTAAGLEDRCALKKPGRARLLCGTPPNACSGLYQHVLEVLGDEVAHRGDVAAERLVQPTLGLFLCLAVGPAAGQGRARGDIPASMTSDDFHNKFHYSPRSLLRTDLQYL